MNHGPQIPYLLEVVIFLVAVVALVPLFQRLKASPVLGYLAVGMVVGPYGLGLVRDVEGVATLAELGVVFLLFTIGLELSVKRLWDMRRFVFGLGGAQVLLCGLVIGLIAWAWGNSAEAAILLGACLALSSTAVVMQLLAERRELALLHGRVSFAILLFQDLAVVPILFVAHAMGTDSATGETSALWSLAAALGRAVLAVAVIVLFGRLLVRPIFRIVAASRNVELFTAVTLLAILGTAMATGVAGLSMALGAFLAGLLLAETEFRHQIEADIQPFKGLMLGLFFISVGMGIDFAAVADRAGWLILSVLGLLAVKATLISGLCLAFGLRRDDAVRVGILLSEAGEFAFVVIGVALTLDIVPPEVGYFMLMVTGLSLVVTPFLPELGKRAGTVVTRRDEHRREAAAGETDELEGHVIIAGFGRVGQTVASVFDRLDIPFVALDLDIERIGQCRRRNLPVHYGDATRREVLERLDVGRAAAVVVTLDDPRAAGRTVATIRHNWPELAIFVRARDARHSGEIMALGATLVVPETVESSLQLAGQVVQSLGTPSEAVGRLLDEIREAEYAGLPGIIPGRKAADDANEPG